MQDSEGKKKGRGEKEGGGRSTGSKAGTAIVTVEWRRMGARSRLAGWQVGAGAAREFPRDVPECGSAAVRSSAPCQRVLRVCDSHFWLAGNRSQSFPKRNGRGWLAPSKNAGKVQDRSLFLIG